MDQVAGRQLAGAEAGIGEQGAGAALDVDPAVHAGRAAVVGDRVELLLALHQVLGQRLEALGAGLEVHGHQRRHAALAGVGHGFGEVQLVGVGVGDDVAVDGAFQRLAGVGADPAAADETLQGGHQGVS
ncbi:hypothetical protein D3C84_910760 [compost metagenome]